MERVEEILKTDSVSVADDDDQTGTEREVT